MGLIFSSSASFNKTFLILFFSGSKKKKINKLQQSINNQEQEKIFSLVSLN